MQLAVLCNHGRSARTYRHGRGWGQRLAALIAAVDSNFSNIQGTDRKDELACKNLPVQIAEDFVGCHTPRAAFILLPAKPASIL